MVFPVWLLERFAGCRLFMPSQMGRPTVWLPENTSFLWERQFLEEMLGELEGPESENILVFSSNDSSYLRIRWIVRKLKPAIIIQLSDEMGRLPRLQKLATRTRLLVRQHHHPQYVTYRNISYLPLGYMTGMLEPGYGSVPLIPPPQRKYRWSFVGALKADREEMISRFQSMEPHRLETDGSVDPAQMREIYRDSVFVPNGRGQKRLDCFRLYEASVCGALPVVVGTESEREQTFRHEGNPPWIFAETWEAAYRKCSLLAQDEPKLLLAQERVVEWWRGRVDGCKRRMQAVFDPR